MLPCAPNPIAVLTRCQGHPGSAAEIMAGAFSGQALRNTACLAAQPNRVNATRGAASALQSDIWGRPSTGSSPPLAARPADDLRLEECLGQTLWSQFLRTMKSSLWTSNLQPAGSGCRCPGLGKVSAGDCPWGGREANAWGCYWGEALSSQAAFSMTFAGQRCFGVVRDRPCRSDFTCTSMSFLK